MTMPDERYRAMIEGMRFLEDLLRPKTTPGVPKYIRDRVRDILRHYPSEYDFSQIAEKSSEFKNVCYE